MDKLFELTKKQMEIISRAAAEKRDLTAEENAEMQRLQGEIDTLERSLSVPAPTQGNSTEGGERNLGEVERNRVTAIMSLCREFEVDAEEYIKNGTTLDHVRAAILDGLKKNNAPVATKADSGITGVTDEGDKFRAAMSDALLMRSGIEVTDAAQGAKELRGMSLRDIAIECLQREGEVNMHQKSSSELFDNLSRQFFNPTSMFPSILDNAIEKSFKEGLKKAPATFEKWVKKGSLKDFKTHDNYYIAGPAGDFLEVPANGELKADTYSEDKLPTRKLKTYGRQFTLDRKAFINDDIDLVTKMPAKYAASAKRTQNKQCYEILVNNPVIYDGVKLFGAGHNNLLAAGTGITREAVQGMTLALQNQVDQFGEAVVIRPATIIVPSGYMFDIYSLFWSPTINTSANTQAVNPLYQYRESIEVVEDPTINVLCGGFGNTMPWWLLGHKDDVDFLEIDYLNGEETPQFRRMEAPGKLGFIWDTYLDWGISVMDYRGAIKNPGTIVDNPIALV